MTTPQPSQRVFLGLFLGFIGVVIFGGTLPMTRLLVMELPPVFMTVARSLVAGVLALVVLLVLRRPWPPRRAWWKLSLVVLGVVLGFPIFMALAMTEVSASHGGIVLGLLPLGTAVAAVFINHDKPPFLFWVFAVLGACVVLAFVMRQGGVVSLSALGMGDVWLLLAGVSACVGYAFSARLTKFMTGWEVISWAVVLALPITGVLTFLLWDARILTLSAPAMGAFAYVALLSQYLGFFFWNAGLAMGGVARVSQIQLLQIFATLVFSALIVNEPLDAEIWVFAALVTVVVGLGAWARKHHARLKKG
jgi:drug/metabolite transporter (DMT)-like permease